MAIVDIDQDVQAAVVNLWNATPGLGAPDPASKPPDAGFIVGQLKAGRLVTGQGTDDKAIPIPYGHIEVKKGKANQLAGSNGAWHDYRNVTLTVRGLEPDVRRAMAYMLATFNLRLQPSLTGTPTLAMPSGAPFVRWWPLNQGERTVEDKQRGGNEIWRAVVIGEVWTTRYDQ